MKRSMGMHLGWALGALLLTLVATTGGCSLVLDFDECASDDDCGEGASCVDQLCQEPESCESDEDCGDDQVCEDEMCVTDNACESDDDCEGDQICEGGECRAPTSCESDSDCERTQECTDQVCEELERVEVTDFIAEDTTWESDKVYMLEDLIFVLSGNKLTIEPGTTVMGAKEDAALVTEAGAKLEAVGTRDEPIVFTSAEPIGRRRSGDWGGVALIGQAEINRPDMDLRLGVDEGYDKVGGEDDTSDCGTLEYVRTEFAGGKIDGEKALNGITFAGCGSDTEVDYIQSHLGDDDGIEIFGGTMDLEHAVVTRPQGDGFDLDVGWRGRGQFWVLQLDNIGEEGFEIENRAEEVTADPNTNPQIYNYTIISANNEADEQRGMIFKAGGMGMVSHGIIMNTATDGVHVSGEVTGEHGENGDINVEQTLFYEIGEEGDEYFTMDEEAEQTTFVAEEYMTQEEAENVFGEDPGIDEPFDLRDPEWRPKAEHTAGGEVDSPPDDGFFDTTAVYRGAISPSDSGTDWTDGWTSFPAN